MKKKGWIETSFWGSFEPDVGDDIFITAYPTYPVDWSILVVAAK